MYGHYAAIYCYVCISVQESDLVLLVGTNPRFEAPLVNTRIRKRYVACAYMWIGGLLKSEGRALILTGLSWPVACSCSMLLLLMLLGISALTGELKFLYGTLSRVWYDTRDRHCVVVFLTFSFSPTFLYCVLLYNQLLLDDNRINIDGGCMVCEVYVQW